MKGAEGGNDRVHELTARKSRCGVAWRQSCLDPPTSTTEKKGPEDQKSERQLEGGRTKMECDVRSTMTSIVSVIWFRK